MSIRVSAHSRSDLRLAAQVSKPNLSLARSIAGQGGQVRGWWQACFVRIPASGFTDNAIYPLFGRDNGTQGAFSANSDHVFRIGFDGVGSANNSGASRLRPVVVARASTGDVGAAGNNHMAAMAQMTRSPDVFLVGYGVRNTGTAGSPVWTGFVFHCRVGGTPSFELLTVAAGYVTGTTSGLLRQVFSAGGALTAVNKARVTEDNTALEHAALAQGDFPWDTVNNRPHFDAIAALAAGSGAATLYDYADLAAAQLAGTLPFSNCDQGLSEITHWFTLENLTAGLTNQGTAAGDNLTHTAQNTAAGQINTAALLGLADESPIAPAHWAPPVPVITAPPVKFFGGRGTATASIAGTYASTVQRRWERMSDNAALAGLDWATVTATAGAFTVADVLPVGGPYRLRVRAAADNAIVAVPLEDVLVGTVAVMHAQSGMELTFGGSDVWSQNHINLPVAAGAQGIVVNLSNKLGGSTATYAQPLVQTRRLIGGETPAIRAGAVACLNAWAAENPGHPLCIVNMAMSGTAMADWANGPNGADLTTNGGHASWRYMGAIGVMPGVSSGNGSGTAEVMAAALGRRADVHVMMWHPGISTDPAVQADYVAKIDARWSANTNAPWVLLPSWRTDNTGSAKGVTARAAHVAMVLDVLGARGWLGPHWGDIVMDTAGSLHAAYSGVVVGAQPVLDSDQAGVFGRLGVGVSRTGAGIGRVAAWVFNAAIPVTFRTVSAWSDTNRATVNVELGKPGRTLNGAAVRADAFHVSTNGGSSWTRSGFTAALAANGTRVVLTPADGGTAWAAAGTNLRIEYLREFIDTSEEQADEALQAPLFDGLIYDAGTWRGRLGAGGAGTVLQGTGTGGLTVEARQPGSRLLTSERFSGSRPVTVRMMAPDGVTVLRERTLMIAAV